MTQEQIEQYQNTRKEIVFNINKYGEKLSELDWDFKNICDHLNPDGTSTMSEREEETENEKLFACTICWTGQWREKSI